MRIPLEPQPPTSVKVVMLGCNVSPSGEQYYNHAVTEAQGDKTIFYHSPVGLPEGLDVVCVDGVWCWEVPLPQEAGHAA